MNVVGLNFVYYFHKEENVSNYVQNDIFLGSFNDNIH